MWWEELPEKSWTSLWWDYVVCGGECPGIRKIDAPCPTCLSGPMDTFPKPFVINGETILFRPTFMGTEGRYEDYIYLQMLQREWERPASEF
jgi:hypothetical protein